MCVNAALHTDARTLRGMQTFSLTRPRPRIKCPSTGRVTPLPVFSTWSVHCRWTDSALWICDSSCQPVARDPVWRDQTDPSAALCLRHQIEVWRYIVIVGTSPSTLRTAASSSARSGQRHTACQSFMGSTSHGIGQCWCTCHWSVADRRIWQGPTVGIVRLSARLVWRDCVQSLGDREEEGQQFG